MALYHSGNRPTGAPVLRFSVPTNRSGSLAYSAPGQQRTPPAAGLGQPRCDRGWRVVVNQQLFAPPCHAGAPRSLFPLHRPGERRAGGQGLHHPGSNPLRAQAAGGWGAAAAGHHAHLRHGPAPAVGAPRGGVCRSAPQAPQCVQHRFELGGAAADFHSGAPVLCAPADGRWPGGAELYPFQGQDLRSRRAIQGHLR